MLLNHKIESKNVKCHEEQVHLGLAGGGEREPHACCGWLMPGDDRNHRIMAAQAATWTGLRSECEYDIVTENAMIAMRWTSAWACSVAPAARFANPNFLDQGDPAALWSALARVMLSECGMKPIAEPHITHNLRRRRQREDPNPNLHGTRPLRSRKPRIGFAKYKQFLHMQS